MIPYPRPSLDPHPSLRPDTHYRLSLDPSSKLDLWANLRHVLGFSGLKERGVRRHLQLGLGAPSHYHPHKTPVLATCLPWTQKFRSQLKASHVSASSLTCSSPFAGESDRATLLNVLEGRVSWSSPMATHLSEDAQDFIKAALQKAVG